MTPWSGSSLARRGPTERLFPDNILERAVINTLVVFGFAFSNETAFGATEQLISGEVTEQVKETLPTNPFSGVRLRSTVPFVPAGITRLVGKTKSEYRGTEDNEEKSGGAHCETGIQLGTLPRSVITKVIEPSTLSELGPIRLMLPPEVNVIGPVRA